MRRAVTPVLMLALAGPLSAQGKGGLLWQFGNLQQGYCISFLVSPGDASSVLPDDAQPMRLEAMTDPPAALARVLQDQPEYGSWMPAAVCVYRFGRADGMGRELVAPADGSEMIGVIAYSARVAVNQPANGVSADLVFTNDKWIAQASDSSLAPIRVVKTTFGKAAHGNDERHVIQFGKTTLIWDGHTASDSVALTGPVERVWVVEGRRRSTSVLLRWKMTPTSSRSMVGALVVEGKDKLASIMRSSPIRYLGPVYQGGTAELSEIP